MIFRWLATNVFTVVVILAISLVRGYESNVILLGKLLAQIAFILFLVNVNMYFVFLLIRKSKVRDIKIRLARISKQMMKYHVPFAVTATVLILAHMAVMGYTHLGSLLQVKTFSGLAAVIVLSVLLFSGYLRRRKATGKRRKFHYIMAFVFFSLALLHIFV